MIFRVISHTVLKMIGWKITGSYPKEVRKKILVAAPHTSNWDFPLGVLVRSQLNDKVSWVGKSALFKPPIGWLASWLGGIPVDRSKSNNFVDGVVDQFNSRKELAILLAAEGKRKRVDRFKTGFYFIARNAKIPIVPTILDYDKKEFRFGELFWPGEDTEADIKALENIFKGIRGYHAKYSFHYPK